ncbi:BTB/POZ domain-containing protein 9-like protein [Leptotrombidium deliense]|uniref:BTB/POZ domain-containing protein 9-like protein n=1 Tax=Leptotrombidium deliense TaxID=299467 RepID=A0A443S4H1_9ACAR|nr:BTB/POZ domain-containing protein 9-like protein [Leptotrombidium deliense]
MEAFRKKLLKNICEIDALKDLSFKFDDGSQIKVNRTLLGASCLYFQRFLFGETNEANQSVIELKSTPKELFEQVLEFLYSGKCDLSKLSEDRVIDLIQLAHEYQFDELLLYLQSIVEYKYFSVTFCVNLFDFLNIAELVVWKEQCLTYFDKIFCNVVNTEIFGKFSRSLVNHLTCRDTFVMKEIDLFNCLLKWKEMNKDEQQDGLFSNLRLNLIGIHDFSRLVIPANVINGNDYITALDEKRFRERKPNGLREQHPPRCNPPPD